MQPAFSEENVRKNTKFAVLFGGKFHVDLNAWETTIPEELRPTAKLIVYRANDLFMEHVRATPGNYTLERAGAVFLAKLMQAIEEQAQEGWL